MFFPEVSAYRIDLDETECMYFTKKEGNSLISIWKLGKKLAI